MRVQCMIIPIISMKFILYRARWNCQISSHTIKVLLVAIMFTIYLQIRDLMSMTLIKTCEKIFSSPLAHVTGKSLYSVKKLHSV